MNHLRTITAALLLSAPIAYGNDWPEVERPPKAHVQSVAETMKYNGIPMRIRQFSSELSVGAIVAFYRDRWSDNGKSRVVLNTLGDWQIVGRQVGDYYETVQVKARGQGGSEGFIGISKLFSLPQPPQVDMQFPRMPGSHVISDIDSNDAGKAAKTIIFKNDSSVASNTSYYQATMPAQEWKHHRGFGGPQSNGSHVLYFERKKESASLVINPDPKGGTVVVVNIVASGT